jgi:putative holliday junction resolvase
LKNYGRIIGIDVGTKRVGLARSDLLQTSANPAGTFSPEQVFSELEKYQKDYPIYAFVVGWPLSASGEITKSTGMAKAFIKKLNKHFPDIPVYKMDERYSSKQAVQNMIQSGIPKMKRREKERVDQAAAALILQKFLELHSDLSH